MNTVNKCMHTHISPSSYLIFGGNLLQILHPAAGVNLRRCQMHREGFLRSETEGGNGGNGDYVCV